MKIAIITFFQSQDNYGQLLQCYSLQTVLRRMGHSPYVIRYGFHQQYFRWLKKKNYLSKQGRRVLIQQITAKIFPSNRESDRRFDVFRRRYFDFSPHRYNSVSELQQKPPKADCYITGSDQVWAQLLSINSNKSFFLDFGPSSVKRVAYAPSFALVAYPQSLKDELREQLRKFDAISVREESGIRICEELGYNATLVLDPTLLLSQRDYLRIMRKPKISNYCFIYHVNITSKEEILWDYFLSYNRSKDYRSIATYANPIDGVKMEFLDGAKYVFPTIEEWLGLLFCSEYVLTSSFHGVVFSVLFHKPFAVCLRKDSIFAGNDRVTTLLGKLKLEDRVIHSSTQIEDIISRPINWDSVDILLNTERDNSLYFLDDSLNC